ncbi:hypothetical protein GOODEAATRI_000760, partial [Goodea atripinnis]
DGIRKTQDSVTMGSPLHQESRLLQLVELDKDTITPSDTRTRGDLSTSDWRGVQGLIIGGFKSGRWRVDDEEILRKLLLISDLFDEL